MGMFQIQVTVSNLFAPARSLQDPFWVDTGAFHSYVPEDRLDAIGVKAFGEREILVADGRVDRRRIGTAVFHLEGFAEDIPCPVIFGPPGSVCLLGATTLENFGLAVDPVSKKLKPVTCIIAGLSA